jgi:hypothetical protein
MTFTKDIPELRKSDKYFHVWENVLNVRPKFSDFESFFIAKGMKFLDDDGLVKDKFDWPSSRGPFKHEDLKYFPGISEHIEELEKIYGKDNQMSYMSTGDHYVNNVHASMHNDKGDVVHFACEGQVKWRLISPIIEQKNAKPEDIIEVIINEGDVLWFRGWTSHETTPLSDRAGIIWLNDVDPVNQNPYYT